MGVLLGLVNVAGQLRPPHTLQAVHIWACLISRRSPKHDCGKLVYTHAAHALVLAQKYHRRWSWMVGILWGDIAHCACKDDWWVCWDCDRQSVAAAFAMIMETGWPLHHDSCVQPAGSSDLTRCPTSHQDVAPMQSKLWDVKLTDWKGLGLHTETILLASNQLPSQQVHRLCPDKDCAIGLVWICWAACRRCTLSCRRRACTLGSSRTPRWQPSPHKIHQHPRSRPCTTVAQPAPPEPHMGGCSPVKAPEQLHPQAEHTAVGASSAHSGVIPGWSGSPAWPRPRL